MKQETLPYAHVMAIDSVRSIANIAAHWIRVARMTRIPALRTESLSLAAAYAHSAQIAAYGLNLRRSTVGGVFCFIPNP